jgi:phosphohistidine phosphatase
VRPLYLLRHAKSSWDDPAPADHDRPLAPRGRRAAKAIGRYLREQGIEPELVLCSSATRAQQTLERAGLSGSIEDGLYGAGAHALLARLNQVPDGVASVMLIGHNPGMEDLLALLTSEAPEKFPTAALATLECPPWSTLARGSAELIGLVRPRELPQ